MKTFEVTFPNGERQIHEATYYRETTEAGTKVLEFYKTVSNYDSQSKPFLYLTGYDKVFEIVEVNVKPGFITLENNKTYTPFDGKLYERVKTIREQIYNQLNIVLNKND